MQKCSWVHTYSQTKEFQGRKGLLEYQYVIKPEALLTVAFLIPHSGLHLLISKVLQAQIAYPNKEASLLEIWKLEQTLMPQSPLQKQVAHVAPSVQKPKHHLYSVPFHQLHWMRDNMKKLVSWCVVQVIIQHVLFFGFIFYYFFCITFSFSMKISMSHLIHTLRETIIWLSNHYSGLSVTNKLSLMRKKTNNYDYGQKVPSTMVLLHVPLSRTCPKITP